jgi:hypothetical protein
MLHHQGLSTVQLVHLRFSSVFRGIAQDIDGVYA